MPRRGLPWDELPASTSSGRPPRPRPLDAGDHERVRPYTLTPPDRVAACAARRLPRRQDVPGAIVECGLWKGGSLMACAVRLHDRGAGPRARRLRHLRGDDRPAEEDVDWRGIQQQPEDKGRRCRRAAASRTSPPTWRRRGYPIDRVRLVKGDVIADRSPPRPPRQIALLRLRHRLVRSSTKHELEQLYPRLAVGGDPAHRRLRPLQGLA